MKDKIIKEARLSEEVIELVTAESVYIVPIPRGKRAEIGVYDDWIGDKISLNEIKDAIEGLVDKSI